MELNIRRDLALVPLADMPSDFAMRDWPVRHVASRDSWFVGADIGQANDPTAVAALQHVITPIGEFIPDVKRKTIKQMFKEEFNVRHLQRLPLGLPYPVQITHVSNLLVREPLDKATFAVDYTGVGRPVFDMFVRAGLRPQGVLITAGNETTKPEHNIWHAPKLTLVSQLEARLHSGELQIARDLAEASALQEELKDFNRSVTAAGRVTYNAREGKHDDLILAVAIALFVALNGPKPAWVTPLPV